MTINSNNSIPGIRVIIADQNLKKGPQKLSWEGHVVTCSNASSGRVVEFFSSIFRRLNPFNLYVKNQGKIYKMSKKELKPGEDKTKIKKNLDVGITNGAIFSVVTKKTSSGRSFINVSALPEKLQRNKDIKDACFELDTQALDKKRVIVSEDEGNYVLYELSINRSKTLPQVIPVEKLRYQGDLAAFQELCDVISSLPENLQGNKDIKDACSELLKTQALDKKRVIVSEDERNHVLYELSIDRSKIPPQVIPVEKLRYQGDLTDFQQTCQKFEELCDAISTQKQTVAHFTCGTKKYLLTDDGTGLIKKISTNNTEPVQKDVPSFLVDDGGRLYGMYRTDPDTSKIQTCSILADGTMDIERAKRYFSFLFANANKNGTESFADFTAGVNVSCVKTRDGFFLSTNQFSETYKQSGCQQIILSLPNKNELLKEAYEKGKVFGCSIVDSNFYTISCFFDKANNEFSFSFSPPVINSEELLKKYFMEIPSRNTLLQKVYVENKPCTDGVVDIAWNGTKFNLSLNQNIRVNDPFNLCLQLNVLDFVKEANKSVNDVYFSVVSLQGQDALVCCQKKADKSFDFSYEVIKKDILGIISAYQAGLNIEQKLINDLYVKASVNSMGSYQVVFDGKNTPSFLVCKRNEQNVFVFTLVPISEKSPLSIPVDNQAKGSLIMNAFESNSPIEQIVYDKTSKPHVISCQKNQDHSYSFTNQAVQVNDIVDPSLANTHEYVKESINNIPLSATKQLLTTAFQKGRADMFIPASKKDGTQTILHVEMRKGGNIGQFDRVVKEPSWPEDNPLIKSMLDDSECRPAFLNMMIQLNTATEVERVVTYQDKNYIVTGTLGANGVVSFTEKEYAETPTWNNLPFKVTSLPIMSKLIARAYNEGKASAIVYVAGDAGQKGFFRRVYVTKDDRGYLKATNEDPAITLEELKNAGVVNENEKNPDQRRVQQGFIDMLTKSKKVEEIFTLAMRLQPSTKGSRKLLIFGNPIVKPVLNQPAEIKRIAVSINIKKTGEVVFGTRKGLASGSFKTVSEVNKFGLNIKKYALLQNKDPTGPGAKILKSEQKVVSAVRHPYIIRGKKEYKEKTVQIVDQTHSSQTGVPVQTKTENVQEYKNVLYREGDLSSLVAQPVQFDKGAEAKKQLIERAQIILDVAKSLSYLHSEGAELMEKNNPVAHMDIKPANIYVTRENERLVGILGDIDPKSVGEGGVICSPLYVPPEMYQVAAQQVGFDSSQKADIWALGLVFYALIYGDGFSKGLTSLNDLYQIPVRLRAVLQQNALIHDVLKKMLADNPTQRIDANALVPELEDLIKKLQEWIP